MQGLNYIYTNEQPLTGCGKVTQKPQPYAPQPPAGPHLNSSLLREFIPFIDAPGPLKSLDCNACGLFAGAPFTIVEKKVPNVFINVQTESLFRWFRGFSEKEEKRETKWNEEILMDGMCE